MRTLLIKGRSLYGGTRFFIESAAEALGDLGHEVEVLDLGEVEDPASAIEAHAAGCRTDFVFSIGILGGFRSSDGRTISELYGARHAVWYVDYPIGMGSRFAATPPSTTVLCIDPTHVEAIQAVYGDEAWPDLRFFPHPGVGDPAPDDADVDAFVAARPIQLLWTGSYQKPERSWGQLTPRTQKGVDAAVDLALGSEWIPPHEAMRRVLHEMGVDVNTPAGRSNLGLAAYVHDFVRKTRRTEFVRAVAKIGVPLHICGMGWEPHLYRYKNAIHEGAVDMSRMVELMRRSRVVLNTNVNFGAGSHERPFSASLAGAATFTDHSRYYDEAFAPGEIAMFHWKDLAGGMADLKALASDPARAFGMGRAAKARAVAQHSWIRRLPAILDAADAHRAAA